MVEKREQDERLTQFQERLERQIYRTATAAHSGTVERQLETDWEGENGSFTVVLLRIGELEVLIHPDEAYIAGRALGGAIIDDRFEKWDFQSNGALEQRVIDQLAHYLRGG